MTIFLPVHDGDKHLAVRNLEHALQLEKGRVEFKAVVHHEQGCEVAEVVDAAKAYFASVIDHAYPKWTGKRDWPWPQNNAWTRAARLVEETVKDSWFWWEADAVPLRAGWLYSIYDAVNGTKRPLAGASVSFGGVNYASGVGVYPQNPSEVMPHAMTGYGDSWDRIAGKFDQIIGKTHDISSLIQHVPDCPNTHFENREDLVRKISPTTVIFHKCKDGSLIDVLQGKSVEDTTPTGPSQKSFLEQTDYECGLFTFPVATNTCYFNPSIVEKDGRRWLFTRRQRYSFNPWVSNNDLAIWEIRKNMTLRDCPIIPKLTLGIKGEQFDDPKSIITSGGKCLVSMASWVHHQKWHCRQVIFQLSDDFRTVEHVTIPKFGGNHTDPEKSTRAEKNWCFVQCAHVPWQMVYSINPHVLISSSRSWENPKLDLKWEFGEPRGGTPAVDIGDHFLSFFHSSIPWAPKKNRYYMGCYAFRKEDPYQVTHISSKPILIGSEEDFRSLSSPPVVFPNGCLYDGKKFLITMGINDENCGWISIPDKDIAAILEPV